MFIIKIELLIIDNVRAFTHPMSQKLIISLNLINILHILIHRHIHTYRAHIPLINQRLNLIRKGNTASLPALGTNHAAAGIVIYILTHFKIYNYFISLI